MEHDNFTYLNNEFLEELDKEDTKYIELAKLLTKDIKNYKLTIVDVIQKLGCLLVNTSFAKREVGILILCEILKRLDLEKLNLEQISVICSYFAEKLKDHHQVATSSLKGVYVLVNIQQAPLESVMQVLTSIFNNITCQQQQQQDRYLIFQIYEAVLNLHKNVVDSMGIDFVYGIISSIDGERDPKNLIYLFKWLQLFLKTVKLDHLTEEMFDVLACYFPVDFKAPPNDKNKITREDLAQSLGQCLTCIPDFGNHAIPLALEKLDSGLSIAKHDSLDILIEGCRHYDADTYSIYSLEIWNQLQKEIFNTSDLDLTQKSLHCVREIIRKLGTCEDQDKFKRTISDIIISLKQNLSPDSKMFNKTSKILHNIAQANETCSLIIVKEAGAFLGTSYQISTNASKSDQLRVYIEFIQTAINNIKDFSLSKIGEISNGPALCLHAVLTEDDSLRVEGYKGFIVLAPYLPDDIIRSVMLKLQETILSEQSNELKNITLLCLQKLAELYPEYLDTLVLIRTKLDNPSCLSNYIGCTCFLVKLPYFQRYIIKTLCDYAVLNITTSTIILHHLNTFLDTIEILETLLLQQNFVMQLSDFLLNISESPNPDYLHNLKDVLSKLIRKQDVLVQQQIYDAESKKNYQNQTLYLTLLSGLITGMKPQSFNDYSKIEMLLEFCQSVDSLSQNIAAQTLANIINKLEKDDLLEDILKTVEQVCKNCQKNREIILTTWVLKGLVTRNHSQAWTWSDKLINLLNDDVNSSKGFKVVMSDTNSISRENNCKIMPLYKQKFFVYVTNKLADLSEDEKHCNAIGYLLEQAPKQAIIGQFKKILKLIFHCLEQCTDPEIIEIILLKLTELISVNKEIIETNLEDILVRILNLTTFEHSMKVRIAAIQGLNEFTRSYPIYKLVPFQQRVIQKLGACVDDKKRIVRKEATECRSFWFLLNAPL